MTDYPMGARVAFADANATTSDGNPGVVSGTVNGPPLDMPDGSVFVPVFTERDNGREATTIYVAAVNVLGVSDQT